MPDDGYFKTPMGDGNSGYMKAATRDVTVQVRAEDRDEHEASQLVIRLASSLARRGEAVIVCHVAKRGEPIRGLPRLVRGEADPPDSPRRGSLNRNSFASSHEPRRVVKVDSTGHAACYVAFSK
jgi:hypothetical protein